MFRRIAVSSALALVLAPVIGIADTEPHRVEQTDYVAPAGDTGLIQCALPAPPLPAPCFGGAIFYVSPADTRVVIEATDPNLPQFLVGFSWEVWTEGLCGDTPDEAVYGCAVARGSGCGILDVALPEVGGQLVILVDGPVYGVLDCGRYIGASIQGTITAAFYRDDASP